MSCSENSNNANFDQNCSPNSENLALKINGVCREFKVVDGKSLDFIDNDRLTYFYATDFTEDFIKNRINEISLKNDIIDNLYDVELFIKKDTDNLEELLINGVLVSAIVHYKGQNNNLRVKYFELDENKLVEVVKLSRIVPFVCATTSYLNFKRLKSQNILANSFSFYNNRNIEIKRSNALPLSKSFTKYLEENNTKNFKFDEPVFDDGTSNGRCDSPNNQCNGGFNDTCETQGGNYKCSNGSGGGDCSASAISNDLSANNKFEESTLLSNTFEVLYQFESYLNNSEKGQQVSNMYWKFSELTSDDGTVSLSLEDKVDIAIFVSNNINLVDNFLNDRETNILYDDSKSLEIETFLNDLKQLSNNSEWNNIFDSLISDIRYYQNKTIRSIKDDF